MAVEWNQIILETKDLRKLYGQHVALDGLNLEIHRGEVFGYVGPNGAGKTTTFRILSGLLDPASGIAKIAGENVSGDRNRIKQLVGFLPDNFGVYPTLRAWEYLDFFASVYKIPKKARRERIDYCLKIANAIEFRDKLMGAVSRGMKQRVGIAKTLLHDPEVLILDEPAATLDPRARIEMRRLLRELADLGKAVLVSSHILPELSSVCDRVGILRGGKLVACGAVQEITRKIRERRLIEVHVTDSSSTAAEVLSSLDGWSPIESPEANVLRYEVQASEQQLRDALTVMLKKGIPVFSFAEVPADLEDVFMSLTK
jgi:ABC-2 type transport system ATP-binding protein